MRQGGEEEDSLGRLAELHGEVKEALEAGKRVWAMKLLEQCQAVAWGLGNRAEAREGKGCGMTAIVDDYCELVYEVNEQAWHGEYVNPGKVFRYLNKSLGLMRENVKMDGGAQKAEE